ncbi:MULTISPECIES: SpoIIE family protein phosphatase [Streptomyces]|uniref:protein-serine/threonine phosphatase n=1 Tax=Streptomyces albus (strain ATCC 21838 / DSM 41398 / FERM P-419 / JCM 4703 / NBRC 107858) TaxID=1081613 RepID=A0A0B5EIR4_STRA4|nr:SpoIIE family protein phosphatase [Streptomyces sp. SCSIO ZS0520]AJE81349.1 putative PAS/PAC sensor protein [Streptomyces albus]AOU75665.1 putative PAS/PAC sensor protein [Streptomyces albus]AYN31467.1 protein phosphatase [Streptomyces albus]
MPGLKGGGEPAAPFDLPRTATAVCDDSGVLTGWSEAAAGLLGLRAREVLGRPVAELLAEGENGGALRTALSERHPGPDPAGVLRARHRDGRTLVLGVQATALTADGGRHWHLSAVDMARNPWWSTSHSVVERFLRNAPFGIGVLDPELRYVWTNTALDAMSGVGCAQRLGRTMAEVLPDLDPGVLEGRLREVLRTGEPVGEFEYRGYVPADPHREHAFSTSCLRLDDTEGRVLGVCYTGVDITERWRTRQRVDLLMESGSRIGTTLDLQRTAEELTEVAVPRMADFAVVDLLEPVLRSEEPAGTPGPDSGGKLRRIAHLSVRPGNADIVTELGTAPYYPVDSPMSRAMHEGRALLVPGPDSDFSWLGHDPQRSAVQLTYPVRSLLAVPLRARGKVLGLATFCRSDRRDPFEPDDLSMAEDFVSRAAVCLDNARRYTREHRTALALQRSLLPQILSVPPSVEVAHRYVPATAHEGVGGDWFDVIRLSGARVALVVGDVVGHGIHAVAAMGRLRTAVHSLADMDLPPDELLAHLDDLVLRVADEQSGEPEVEGAATAAVGARCLYVVHDPATRRCTVARAGHVPPALLSPEGTVTFPELPAGPPLGVGALPFEAVEFALPEGATLVLYTDGLLRAADTDLDEATARLRTALAGARPDLQDAADDVLAGMGIQARTDDVALLLARPHGLSEEQMATWELRADPAEVARARALAAEALEQWGLQEMAFTTELIVSELVTNAIRYAAEPIRLRLIRQSVLTCEVTDGTSTSPRLRHARTTDEGGRGLFMIAQLARRWGTRYSASGKIIWAEQVLPDSGPGL